MTEFVKKINWEKYVRSVGYRRELDKINCTEMYSI